MKKLIKTILALAVLAGVMLFTCPEEEKHVDKLTQEILASANDSQNDDGGSNLLSDLGEAIIGSISEKAVHLYVKNQLEVENHKVLNVGKMYYNGEKRVVTVGAFQHVFCLVKAYDMLDEIEK